MNQITLLSPWSEKYKKHMIAGKKFIKQPSGIIDSIQFSNAYRFKFIAIEWANILELAEILEWAEKEGHWFSIRGKLKDELDINQLHPRRFHPRDDVGEEATIDMVDGGVKWLCVDIDSMPNEWGEPSTIEESLALSYSVVLKALPKEFHKTVYWYQWSSSMGVKDWDYLKIHLWFVLKNGVEDTILQQWAQTTDYVDDAPFRTVQPNYIGRPVFKNMNDPIGDWRSGLVSEWATDIEVDFKYQYVDQDEFIKQSEDMIRLREALLKKTYRNMRTWDFDHVSQPIKKLMDIGVGGRLHLPITKSAASWITCGYTDKDAWKGAVRERVMLSGHPEAYHRASDRYLDAQWRSAEIKWKSSVKTVRGLAPPELLQGNNRNQF